MNTYFDDNIAESGHARRALNSGAVSLIARGINATISIVSVLFLARLLSPEDYGLVAMVTAITGFAPQLVDLGTHDAVVQRPRILPSEVSALFWITMAVGTFSAVTVASCSTFIAQFYGEPRLKAITIVSALSFIASALTCQHYALLRRAMRFTEIGVVEVSANLVSAGMAVSLAFSGSHYWALVLRPLLNIGLLAVGVWWCCGWLPPMPAMTTGVKEMLKFGIHSVGFTMSDFTGRSGDKVAIGYKSGARALGIYQNAAFVYDNVLDILSFPLHSVAVSSLSKVRNDLKELKRLWSKALSVMVFFAMPPFGLLAITGYDIVTLLLGPKWRNAGVLLSVLALRGIPHCVERTAGWLHLAAGRSDRWARYGVFNACMQLTALGCGLPFGPMGVVTAYVIYSFVIFIPAIAYAGRPLGIGAGDVIRAVWRTAIASLGATAIGFWVRSQLMVNVSPISRVVLLAATFSAAYIFIVVGLFRLRMPIAVALSLVQNILPSNLKDSLRIQHLISDLKSDQWNVSRAGQNERLRPMEQLLLSLDTFPCNAIYRVALGFATVPLMTRIGFRVNSIPTMSVGLLLMLAGNRVLLAFLRKAVRASETVKRTWEERRQLGKRYDSYQWRKLLWVGLGLASYSLVFREHLFPHLLVSLFCIATGFIGTGRWYFVSPQLGARTESR